MHGTLCQGKGSKFHTQTRSWIVALRQWRSIGRALSKDGVALWRKIQEAESFSIWFLQTISIVSTKFNSQWNIQSKWDVFCIKKSKLCAVFEKIINSQKDVHLIANSFVFFTISPPRHFLQFQNVFYKMLIVLSLFQGSLYFSRVWSRRPDQGRALEQHQTQVDVPSG